MTELIDHPTTTRHPLLTDQELADLAEIDRLLNEANRHALDGSGGGKSSEGHISVDLGDHWERAPEDDRVPPKVSIFAYLIGPHRSHDFDNTAQALEVVRQWHRREMAYDYTTDARAIPDEPDLYLAIEEERRKTREAAMRYFEEYLGSGGEEKG